LEEAESLIDEANQQHFVNDGVYVGNPLDKGFRVVYLFFKIFHRTLLKGERE